MVRKNEETFVLAVLKIIDSAKYKNAYLSEIPDIQTVDKSVGVEIVRADYDELIKSFKTIGKNIIDAKKINGDSPLTDNEIEEILYCKTTDIYGNTISLQESEKCHYLYVDKKDMEKPTKEIIDYDDLIDKSKKYKIWEVDNAAFDSLDKNYKVIIGRPVVIWVENWYKLFIKRIDSKIEKFDTYNKFKENNLAVISAHTYDDNFEQVAINIKEYYKDKYMPFDNAYLICGDIDKTMVLNFNKNRNGFI